MDLIFKTGIASDGSLDFVLSDETVDRYGDVIEAAGWVLSNFRKNPIALFGHSSSFPIGTWSNIRVEGGKLIAKLNLAKRGTSPRIDELIGLVEQGILRAVSVGFRPIKSEPLNPDRPYGPQKYTKQELLETSLVSVPANPAALALAKSLNISDETMSLAFGEHAEVRRKDVSATGKQADTTTTDPSASSEDPPPSPSKAGSTTMKTLSQRIQEKQTALVAKKDKLTELTGADELDTTAIGEVTAQLDTEEKELEVLKAAEAKIGAAAISGTAPTVPASPRRPLGHAEKDGMDLLVKALVVRGVAHFGGMSIDKAIETRYPGHEAVGIIAKADQTIGTTGVSGWASELVQTAYLGFLQALIGKSLWPELVNRSGLTLQFDRWGTLSLPRRTAGGAGGGFVEEGKPIRVGKITVAAASLVPKKMGVIVAFSKELAKRSTPQLEGIVRQAIIEDTSTTLDPILLDATAVSNARPAGLLNGVSAVGVGFAGGDYQAVKEDIRALLAPFHTANAADGIVVLMNPTQGLNMSLMEGPIGDPNWLMRIKDRVTFIESTNVTAGRLIAIRASDFAGAGGEPDFDVSEQATIHMEDTTPLEIVSGTGPTTADPVRSLWQTNSVGVRMLMDVSWTMRRDGMVQWVNGTTW